MKTIVVRNLFSFEYEGSNPSLPTIKYKKTCILFLLATANKSSSIKEWNMSFETNKEKGNTGLGIAIAYYTSNGYIVSIPLNDTQDYD